MHKRILILVHLVVPLFILHLLEEVATGFYTTDASIRAISLTLDLPLVTTYLLTQIIAFIFFGILLVLVLKKKIIPFFLVLVLNVILLYEFSHTFAALRAGEYVSGFVTGTLLGVLGLGLAYTLIKGAVKGE